jgi:hypothetical protein
MNADGARGEAIPEKPPRMIKRRLAVYVSGFDLRGHKFLYSVFREELDKHVALAGIKGATSAVEPSPADKPWLKRWRATIDDGEAPVETVIDFLEWQDLIPRRRKNRFVGGVVSGLSTGWTMIWKGIFWRLRYYGRTHLALALYPFLMLILYLAVMVALVVGGFAIGWSHGLPFALLGAVAGALLAAGWYWLTRRYDRRMSAWFSLDFWAFQRMQGEENPAISRRFDAFAEHVLEMMADQSYDEVVVFALSTGGFLSIDLLGAMLERDPDFLRSRRKRVPFITFGVAPSAAGWFGPSERFLKALKAILASPAVVWVSYAIRKDMMAAPGYNPVRDFKLDPALYGVKKIIHRRIDLRQMLHPQSLAALRGNYFRKHLHYMMASETGEGHDFFSIICGPRPVLRASSQGVSKARSPV